MGTGAVRRDTLARTLGIGALTDTLVRTLGTGALRRDTLVDKSKLDSTSSTRDLL